MPKGTAKTRAPINRNEFKEAIDGSLKPCFRRKIFNISIKATCIRLSVNSKKIIKRTFLGRL
jgi:hypothetical protein|tara:strand:+ start:93 stop:278 length:186 start_codon:yes stop_codon:yes gene_type:complete